MADLANYVILLIPALTLIAHGLGIIDLAKPFS